MLKCFSLFVVVFVFLGCSLVKDDREAAIERIEKDRWPLMTDEGDTGRLRDAVSASIAYYERLPGERPVFFGADRYTAEDLAAGLRRFRDYLEKEPSADEINAFVRENGKLYAYREGSDPVNVLFTGYFEPELAGSRNPCEKYRYPVYARPEDLVVVRLSSFPVACEPERIVGRFTGKEVVPYYSRQAIDEGAIEEKALPLAWVDDPVALFFLHVQGSGRVALESGGDIHLHFDVSNGRPYRSIGRHLIDAGAIEAADMSMQAIAGYIRDNPDEAWSVLHYNPRYIFFKSGKQGAVGSLNVPLTPERSLAMDPSVSPPGTLLFIETRRPVRGASGDIEKWEDFSGFALNQDTGAAIRGPRRADLFWGSGDYAETAAGHMQHPGRVYFVVIDTEDLREQYGNPG